MTCFISQFWLSLSANYNLVCKPMLTLLTLSLRRLVSRSYFQFSGASFEYLLPPNRHLCPGPWSSMVKGRPRKAPGSCGLKSHELSYHTLGVFRYHEATWSLWERSQGIFQHVRHKTLVLQRAIRPCEPLSIALPIPKDVEDMDAI